MSSKKARREQAIRRKQRNKKIIISACILVVVAVVGFFSIYAFTQRDNRVFADGNQRVTLRVNGNFSAQLPHGVNISGTYNEEVIDGHTIITFIYGGSRSQGSIEGDVLMIPSDWVAGCGHGHNNAFPQTRGPRQGDSAHDHNHDDEHHHNDDHHEHDEYCDHD